MATAEATPEGAAPAEQPNPPADDGLGPDTIEDGSLKRKASDDNPNDDSPKRARHDDSREAATEASKRSKSPSRSNLKEVPPNIDQDRRRLVAQEEKKRGKRLFGSLMSTLSQTSSNTSQQQKRRLEIEHRQQERMQKQKAEDDQKRAEKLDQLNKVRVTEQISFEEDVRKNKHAKRLAMARYLQTRSEPRIYYLPWKTTPEQEDVIDEQILDAKASIAREAEQFKTRKQRHIERYGPPKRRQRSATPSEPAGATRPDAESSVRSPPHTTERPPEQQQQHKATREEHDESGDVLEEADEDMVIY